MSPFRSATLILKTARQRAYFTAAAELILVKEDLRLTVKPVSDVCFDFDDKKCVRFVDLLKHNISQRSTEPPQLTLTIKTKTLLFMKNEIKTINTGVLDTRNGYVTYLLIYL